MILTPEQEALVEAGAMLLSGDHPTSWERRPDNKKQLRELVRAGIVAPDTITRDDYRDDARAIIPLIYTAGRRAGREEAAVDRSELEQRGAELVLAYHMAICSPKGVVPMDKFYDPAIATDLQNRLDATIRNLSEQESGR